MSLPSTKVRKVKCPICGELFIGEPGFGRKRLVLNNQVSHHLWSAHAEYVRRSRRWNRKASIYFFLGLLVIIMTFIGTSTRYGGSGRPIIRAGINSPYFLPALLIFSIPLATFLVYNWRLKRYYVTQWQEKPHFAHQPLNELLQTDQASILQPIDDSTVPETARKIIEDTRELSNKLGLKCFNPSIVRWLPIHPPENCNFEAFALNEVDIPLALKGTVEPDELRPLIASALIYKFKYGKGRAIALSLRLLASLIIIIPSIFVLLLIAFAGPFGVAGSIIAGILAVLTMFSAGVLPKWFRARFLKSQRLDADLEAAGLVGKNALVQTLQKIDSLEHRDAKPLRSGWRARLSDTPRLSDRIDRLLQGVGRPEIGEIVTWQGRPAYHLLSDPIHHLLSESRIDRPRAHHRFSGANTRSDLLSPLDSIHNCNNHYIAY